MCPVFFRWGSLEISSWAIMYMLGALAGMYVSILIDKQQKLQIGPKRLLIFWLGIMYFAGLGGSKALQIFVMWISGEPISHAGKAFYGGMLFIIILAILAARLWRLSAYKLLDTLFLAGCLSGVVGRIGCLLNGCCRGDVVHQSIFAIKYPHISNPGTFPSFMDLLFGLRWQEYLRSFQGIISVHPAPILYSIGFLLMFIFLYTKRKQINQNPGTIFYMWLILHGILRIVLEMIRNNPPYLYGKVNISGILSIASIFVGTIAIIVRRQRRAIDLKQQNLEPSIRQNTLLQTKGQLQPSKA